MNICLRCNGAIFDKSEAINYTGLICVCSSNQRFNNNIIKSNQTEIQILEHKLKCLEIHRKEADKKMEELKRQHQVEIDHLKWQHKKNFWKKFLPPKVRISFSDEYDD